MPQRKDAMKQLGQQIGEYRLLGQLSNGRNADLYAVNKQADPAKIYALKMYHPASHAEQLVAAINETVVPLSHPRVAKTHAAFVHDERACVVMDFVEGETLAALMRADPASMTTVVAIALAIELASALQDASNVVMHGDLCPQHVIIGYDGKLAIVEHGLAAAERMVRPSLVRGHFGYMSPEIATAQDADSRADLYSLALILWEMLSGNPAIKGESDVERRTFAAKPKIPPLKIEGRVNQSVNETVMQALVPDRSERPSSCGSFARLLKQQKSFQLHLFKRDAEIEKLIQRHFHARARAARLLRERWKSMAPVRAPSSTALRLPSGVGLPPPNAVHRAPPPIAAPLPTIAVPLPPPMSKLPDLAPEPSLLGEMDPAITGDLPPPTMDLPRPVSRPLSFTHGVALIMAALLVLLLSTFAWGPGPRAVALEIGQMIAYGSDRVLAVIARD